MRRFLAALVSLLACVPALAATVEEDVQRYLSVLQQSDPRFQANELENLSGAGLSDPRLFDAIEQRLIADVEAVRAVHLEKNRVAWYFRALGFSGQAKYQPTLSRYTEDRTYRNYAIAALRDLPLYEKWNPVISNRASFDPNRSDDANRIVNMLRSDDILLQRVGAKRAFLMHQNDPAVSELLVQRLRESYKIANDTEGVETTGWMLNAISRADMDRNVPLFREVSLGAQHHKVRERAKSLLDRRR